MGVYVKKKKFNPATPNETNLSKILAKKIQETNTTKQKFT